MELSWNTGTLSPSLVRDWEQHRCKSKALQEQSIKPGCGHLVQASALQPSGEAPADTPKPACTLPFQATGETLQIHSHGPMQGCRVLPTPKLNKQFPTFNFQHRLNHSHPSDILIRNKDIQLSTYSSRGYKEKQEEKENTPLYVFNISIWNILFGEGNIIPLACCEFCH